MAVKRGGKVSAKLARKEAEYAALMAAKRGEIADQPPPPEPPEDDTVYIAEPFPEPTAFGARPSGKGDDFAVLAKPLPSPPAPTKAPAPNVFDNIGICFICAGTSCGLGVSDGFKAVRFYCSECGTDRAKVFANMRNGKLNEVESQAIDEAGAEMGAYLESIDKTDIAKMTSGEFRSFCRRFLASYIKSARQLAKYNLPD